MPQSVRMLAALRHGNERRQLIRPHASCIELWWKGGREGEGMRDPVKGLRDSTTLARMGPRGVGAALCRTNSAGE